MFVIVRWLVGWLVGWLVFLFVFGGSHMHIWGEELVFTSAAKALWTTFILLFFFFS